MEEERKIVIYKTGDGETKLEVNIQEETVWLSQAQMVALFQKTKQNISLHIRNIFREGELRKKAVVKERLTTAADGKKYKTSYYNLDVVISVGYRVKSNRGTQFRIWATSVLKDHLISGYTINENRLKHDAGKLKELERTIRLIDLVVSKRELSGSEATSLIKLLSDYNYALDVLDEYDNKALSIHNTTEKCPFRISYDSATDIIAAMKKKIKTPGLFGIEKDRSFFSSINAIYQTHDGRDLYQSVEEKAANLIYLLVKNHSFVDGNKRIAAAIFIWFLERNGVLYRSDGSKRVQDNALIAITLLIAESNPAEHKDIVTLVVNLINRLN